MTDIQTCYAAIETHNLGQMMQPYEQFPDFRMEPHKLLTGEIRVADLDLFALSSQPATEEVTT